MGSYDRKKKRKKELEKRKRKKDRKKEEGGKKRKKKKKEKHNLWSCLKNEYMFNLSLWHSITKWLKRLHWRERHKVWHLTLIWYIFAIESWFWLHSRNHSKDFTEKADHLTRPVLSLWSLASSKRWLVAHDSSSASARGGLTVSTPAKLECCVIFIIWLQPTVNWS